MISEAEFGERVDEAFEAVEYALDEVDSDLDYEAGGGGTDGDLRERYDYGF